MHIYKCWMCWRSDGFMRYAVVGDANLYVHPTELYCGAKAKGGRILDVRMCSQCSMLYKDVRNTWGMCSR